MWKQHFDKLLLAGLFLFAFISFLVFSHSAEFYSNTKNAEHLSDVIHWLEGIVGQILAALLTMMVGRSLAASAHAEPNGKTDVQIGNGTPDPDPNVKTQ
jgi:hypothetical protein